MFSTPQNKRNPSYLVRNPHGYCFRLIVPGDLQNAVCKGSRLKSFCMDISRYRLEISCAKKHHIYEVFDIQKYMPQNQLARGDTIKKAGP